MNADERKTGTREWSEHSLNVCLGCANDCLYCYAAANAARFGRRLREQWRAEWIDWIKAQGPAFSRKYAGRVMFPTAHDFTGRTLETCCHALTRLLWAGNDVLLVSKCWPSAVESIGYAVREAGPWDSLGRNGAGAPLPELRVSIGAVSETVARFWEPGAPSLAERLRALATARNWELPTSVSAEPLLEPHRALELVEAVEQLCVADRHGRGGQIWIGRANQLAARTAWARGRVAGLDGAVRQLEAGQTAEQCRKIHSLLAGHAKVRWKDSFQRILGIDQFGKPTGSPPACASATQAGTGRAVTTEDF